MSYNLQLYFNLVPKETSAQVFSCKKSKIFTNSFFLNDTSDDHFSKFEKVTVQYWAAADLLLSIKKIICRMVSTNKVCRSGQIVLLDILVETIPALFYWLAGRKQRPVQSKALQQRLFVLTLIFWQCRKVFFAGNSIF